jgi:hypothetical protein
MNQLQNSIWSSRSEIGIMRFLSTFVGCMLAVTPAIAQQIASSHPPAGKSTASIGASDLQLGDISGTVFDVNNDIVPGATVTLEDPNPAQLRSVVANNDGAFEFDGVKPGHLPLNNSRRRIRNVDFANRRRQPRPVRTRDKHKAQARGRSSVGIPCTQDIRTAPSNSS